mgnify:CR=1 FL=1|jgi:uncharacterized protein (TIGR02001 family)|tara:strand:- start:2312 stop:2941 length:630 start_codon:yes stop_codon:yes gene_type:complete
MKTLAKILSVSALVSGSFLTSSVTNADVSYNVGFVSEYYYRGIYQKNASASAGVDYEQNGFYVGAWTADVGDGLEVDGYLGYGGEIGDLNYGVGFTGYYYTGGFDETYEEVNLSAGYGPLSIGYSIGEWEGDGGTDYDFLEVSIDLGAGFYGLYGSFGDEFDGDYFEVGYATSVSEIDLGVALIFPSDELEGTDNADGEGITLSIGKSF